jgi:hypothetical protein
MITADKLTLLTNMPAVMLEQALPEKNRPNLVWRKFLGITNGHQFCYAVVDVEGVEGKVFLSYIHDQDQVVAVMG